MKAMRYLRLIPVLMFAALMASCNTTKKFEKLYYAKEYDKVIQSFAPDICKGDRNAERINLVAASYHNANQADHERIQTLKASGQPDVWPEIYQRYCSMRGRNEALKCFPNKVKKGMNYVKLDLDDDLMAARNKAENYLVAKANQLLSTGSKEDALETEKYIQQLNNINKDNVNLSLLQRKALLNSADRVLVAIENEDERPLLPEFVSTILSFEESEVPDRVVCGSKRMRKKYGDAEVLIVVKDIQVSPIRLDEVTFKETNDGKIVEVTDHSQNKTVTVSGIIKYYDNIGYRPIAATPFDVTSTFKNDYTTIKGDREACSAETLQRLNSKSVPVPTDESMLLDAAKKLNDLLATELKK